jgi:hypothetical protein
VRTRFLTTAELAERTGYSASLIERVLVEEVERGHVRRVGPDSWASTPKLLGGFGRAFRDCERDEVTAL